MTVDKRVDVLWSKISNRGSGAQNKKMLIFIRSSFKITRKGLMPTSCSDRNPLKTSNGKCKKTLEENLNAVFRTEKVPKQRMRNKSSFFYSDVSGRLAVNMA